MPLMSTTGVLIIGSDATNVPGSAAVDLRLRSSRLGLEYTGTERDEPTK
jgi:hypothetical protein